MLYFISLESYFSFLVFYEEIFYNNPFCLYHICRFGVGSNGRLCVGLYVLFLEKWLEHFPLKQFLVLRLETYRQSPQQYMNKVIEFLSLDMPAAATEKDLLLNNMIEKKTGNKNM